MHLNSPLFSPPLDYRVFLIRRDRWKYGCRVLSFSSCQVVLIEHFLHMNCGKIMDDFVWLDMISVPLGFGRLFLVPKWSILFHLDVQVCLWLFLGLFSSHSVCCWKSDYHDEHLFSYLDNSIELCWWNNCFGHVSSFTPCSDAWTEVK